MTDDALLDCVAVGRTYPGEIPTEALRPSSLRIGAGEYVAVMGRSGSGKSTLLNIIGLLDQPTTGRYFVDGIDTADLNEVDRTALRAGFFGFVFQAFYLLSARTVCENVELGMLYANVKRHERRDRAERALARVGLEHRSAVEPPTLSGGERQRVAIARALAVEPQVLLCDEPTGNLDSATASSVLDLLGELQRGGLTLVVVSHDPLVEARAERVIDVLDGVVSERIADETAGEH